MIIVKVNSMHTLPARRHDVFPPIALCDCVNVNNVIDKLKETVQYLANVNFGAIYCDFFISNCE